MQTKRVEDDVTREKRIDFLEQYYLRVLAEDRIGGTKFDLTVLDAIKVLREKYPDSNKERNIGLHPGCGGNVINKDKCTWCDKCKQYFCGCACG